MLVVRPDVLATEPVSHDPSISKQVLLRSGALPHITQLARTRLPPGACLTPHAHPDMNEVFVVLSGCGRVRTDSGEVSLDAGCCVRIDAGERHSFSNTGSEDLELLYFGVLAS